MQVIFYILLNIIHQVNLRCICRAINRCGYGIIQTKKNIATNGIQSTITVADPPSGYGGQPHTMAFQRYQSHTCVPVVCTGFAQGSKKTKRQSRSIMFRVLCIQFYRLMQLIFFPHHLRALSAKNANHIQTTDTLKRHQRHSIHYHCG